LNICKTEILGSFLIITVLLKARIFSYNLKPVLNEGFMEKPKRIARYGQ